VAMRETTAAYHARAAMRERGGAPVTVRVGTVETLGPVAHKGATSREIALSKLDWMCDLVSRARRATTSRGKDEGRECRPAKTQETGEKGSADSEYAGKSMRIAESLHRKLLAERDAWANVLRALKDYSDEGERAGVIA